MSASITSIRRDLLSLVPMVVKKRKAAAMWQTDSQSHKKIERYLVENWDHELQEIVEEAVRLARP